MSRNYANIFTAIWGDPDWRALDERSQRMYLLLATQKNISAAGMLPLTIGRWAGMAEDSTPAKVREGLRRLAVERFVAVDEEHEELLVRTFVRHDNGYNNKKRRMVIEAAAGEIESKTLRQVLAVELVRLGLPAGWTREEPVDLPGLPNALDGGDEGSGGRPEEQPAEQSVGKPEETVFPQVDSPYQNPGRVIPETGTSDRVVVTEDVVVRTSTLNPQPAPVAVPAQRTPTVVTPGWLKNDTPETTKTLIPQNAPHTGRQSGLFTTTNLKLSDREQVILDWLRSNDYIDATADDAKAVDKLTRKAYPGKNIGYLRGIASNTGFGNLFEQMRRDRASIVDEQIKKLEQTEPSCAHGTLAGNALHPTHGTMLCAQCRAGIPAVDDSPSTEPAVAAALDAYRSAYGQPLTTVELISLTQQATAFHAEGATPEQLVTLASSAARTGVGLLAAATRKDS
jgi:hypothetical protein